MNITWINWPDPKAVTKGYENLSKFSEAYIQRKNLYSSYTPSQEAINIASCLEENGYTKIENFVSHDLIDRINQKTELILNDALHPDNQNKISQEEAKKTRLYSQVNQPLVSVKDIHELVFNDLIIDIAGAYMDCQPAFGTCNLRKSYVNDLPEGGTQIYHVDPNSPRFLKFFIYLDDVDINGGPFCYVEGSHTKKFEINGQHWNSKYSWDTNSINQIYGEDKVKYLTAKKGDLLIADTNGWHRGTKPINKERTMLTLNYVCHLEEFRDSRFSFSQNDFNNLNDKYKPLCDFLELI